MAIISYLQALGIKSSVELSSSQARLLQILGQTDNHVFVTGKAGSGKSTVLREYKRRAKQKVVITAPTGIAALNVNGQTLHSFFHFGIGLKPDKPKLSKSAQLLIASIDVLIIDEVSMVRVDMIDAIDRRLRQAKNNNLAFGGVRLILFGDLYQLPPIVSDPKLRNYLYEEYRSLYFFKALVWKLTTLEIYELNTVFRQTDQNFKTVLNEIREGRVSSKSLNLLNSQTRSISGLPEDVITLSSTNQLVEEINKTRLKAIGSKQRLYKTKLNKSLSKQPLKSQDLRLKKGAKVMFTKNDPNGRYVNGSLGSIRRLTRHRVWVRLNSRTIRVTRVKLFHIEYAYNERTRELEEKEISLGKQFPICLAWAVTIHKSQGQTYEQCAIDLKKGAFAHGQAYVALSRCTSLSGLRLLSPIMPSDISVDLSIKEFMKKAKKL